MTSLCIIEPKHTNSRERMDPCDTVVESETWLLPITTLEGYNHIGSNTLVQGTRLEESQIGDNCNIRNSEVVESKIGNYVTIKGADIKHSNIKNRVSIGPGAEIKRAAIESNVAIPHLCHLADCTIREGSNIAFGVCICNFDGFTKNPVTIGKNCFIGTGVYLISPCQIGDESYIAARITLPANTNIPPHSLIVGSDRNFVVKPNRSFSLGKHVWVTTKKPTEPQLIKEIIENLFIYKEAATKAGPPLVPNSSREWLTLPNEKIIHYQPLDLLKDTFTYENLEGAAALKKLLEQEIKSLSTETGTFCFNYQRFL